MRDKQSRLAGLLPNQREQVRRQLEIHDHLPATISLECRLGQISFSVSRDVTMPMSSRALAAYLANEVELRGRRVLDMGTGCGIQAAICAIGGAATVIAVDVSPAAMRCAQQNIERLQLSNVTLLESDLFSKIPKQQFDLIVFAQPLFSDEPIPERPVSRGMLDPGNLIDRFLGQLPDWLAHNGQTFMLAWDFAGDRNDPRAQRARFPALQIVQVDVGDIVDGPQIGPMAIVRIVGKNKSG